MSVIIAIALPLNGYSVAVVSTCDTMRLPSDQIVAVQSRGSVELGAHETNVDGGSQLIL